MPFIAKNPINSVALNSVPATPIPGTRSIFPMNDGWYEMDSEGNVRRLGADSIETIELTTTTLYSLRSSNELTNLRDNKIYKIKCGSRYGWLFVTQQGLTMKNTIQTIIDFNGDIYHRYLSAEEWSDWIKYATIEDLDKKIEEIIPPSLINNILDGTGTGSLQQSFDGSETLDFTGKNPALTADNISTYFGDGADISKLPKGGIGNFATALGGKSIAKGKRSVSEGTTTIAIGAYSHAEGDNSVTLGDDSHAEGYVTLAQGSYSHSEGYNTIAKSSASHAEGNSTKASGISSHSEGHNTEALGYVSHAEGQKTLAVGSNSHAEGYTTTAYLNSSHAEGYKTTAIGDASHSEGNQTSAGKIASNIISSNSTNKTYTVVDGSKFSINNKYGLCKEVNGNKEFYFDQGTITSISGNVITVDTFSEILDPLCIFMCESSTGSDGSDGDGSETNPDADTTLGSISHAEGLKTLTMGTGSHAEGVETSALGEASHAEGYMTSSQGSYSHSEGRNSIAKGEISHAEGSQTTASGTYSHSEGWRTTASSDGSHAEGLNTIASNTASHAEGYTTVASGTSSHSEGHDTEAIGNNSHAEGYDTQALGYQSHAEGSRTKASGENQHVQGRYNIEDAANKYAHIVGNGADDTDRSNAHTLDWDGNVWFAGNIKIGGTSYDDDNAQELATKTSVIPKISLWQPNTSYEVGNVVLAVDPDGWYYIATCNSEHISSNVDSLFMEGTGYWNITELKTPSSLNAKFSLEAEKASADANGNYIDLTYATKTELRPTPITDTSSAITANNSYNYGEQTELSIAFPTTANDGDVVYITFTSGATATVLTLDTTNTSDIELIPEANTGYEVYAKYNGAIWIVNYSDYTVTAEGGA